MVYWHCHCNIVRDMSTIFWENIDFIFLLNKIAFDMNINLISITFAINIFNRIVRILSGRKLLSSYFDHFSDQNLFKKLPSVYKWQNTNHILNLNGASKREYAIWFSKGRLRGTWTTCATETTNTPRNKLRTERDRFVTEVFMGKDLEYQFIFHRT